jgi:hypothetical protein
MQPPALRTTAHRIDFGLVEDQPPRLRPVNRVPPLQLRD